MRLRPASFRNDDQEKEDNASAVVDKLQPAFLLQDRQARQFIKETYFDVIHDVKLVHSHIDRSVSHALLGGLSAFVASSQKFEDAILREQDLVRSSYNQKKKELETMYMQLAKKRHESHQLVEDLGKDVADHGNLYIPFSAPEPDG